MQRKQVSDRAPGNICRANRHDVETTISFRIRGEEEWRDGVTGNISLSGLLFRSDHVLKPSTPIEMKLEIPPALRGAEGVEVFRRGVIVRSSVCATECGDYSLAYGAIVLPDAGKSTVAILGVPVDNLSMDEAMQVIENQITDGGFHQIATANVDFLIQSIHDDELHEVLCRCDLVLPDGMPLVWASRLMGKRLKERVAGADLVPRLAELSARRGYRVFLLGAEEESSARAAAWMEKNYPGVCIAGRYSPEFKPLEQMDNHEILRRIEEARPDILLVAFGNPKQEKWLAMHRHLLHVPLCIGIGASLDFLSGKVSRAPQWMQASCLEWAYRLCQEPTRLTRRYLKNAAGLFCFMSLQLAATTAQAGRASSGKFTGDSLNTATVFRIDGGFSSSLLPSLETEVCSAIFSGSHVVFDLSNTTYIGPDAIGSLVHLQSIAHRCKREFWLTGLRPFLKRVISATQLRSRFRLAPQVAEALRRIEPVPAVFRTKGEGNWTFCRIGGEMVPIHAHEVQDLYRQMQFLMKQKTFREQVAKPITVKNSLIANGPAQADQTHGSLESIERVS